MKRKPKILIVDDEPGLVRLLALLLTKRYEVRSIYDAAQILDAAVEFRPDLILLDWVMPQMHGGDVAQQIRADPRLSDTRILFHSAVLSKKDEHGEMAGFPAIAKPIGLNELVEAIEKQWRPSPCAWRNSPRPGWPCRSRSQCGRRTVPVFRC
jgi:DNA-binding response OmpR family regulator